MGRGEKEYRPALDYKNPAADVCQEHMDRVLKEIIRDKAELIPHAERYKDLKKVTYGGRNEDRTDGAGKVQDAAGGAGEK